MTATVSNISMAKARVERSENNEFTLIFTKTDNSTTKRNEVGVRLTRECLTSLLYDCLKQLI